MFLSHMCTSVVQLIPLKLCALTCVEHTIIHPYLKWWVEGRDFLFNAFPIKELQKNCVTGEAPKLSWLLFSLAIPPSLNCC